MALAEISGRGGVSREEFFAATEPMTMHPTGGTTASVQYERFEGPLDLLLDEVRRQMWPSRRLPWRRSYRVSRLHAHGGRAQLEPRHRMAAHGSNTDHWKSRSLPLDSDGQQAERIRFATAWSNN